ncbi:RNA-binding protein 28 isoform X2 [Oncorhynchus tshawytscha]|uniref:RNA-binding protein 28 isoform X2 n=1 Tax=Oncorhynchus tshawytscha TaxID=74940 RepID=UPI000D0991CC|nr:RNA-binding protein 28 isoform X2 [Oncorhynchus tshawytscha]
MSALTIFVRSLPADASNDRLEEIFSEIGPVKHCFVVKEKGAEKCRGFGYVTYSMEEDAQRAVREVKDYDGQKINVSVAKKKLNDKKRGTTATAPKDPVPQKEQKSEGGLKKNRRKARLIIRNLSFKCSNEDLKQTFAKFGTVLEANIPLKPDGKMRGFAFVQFKNVLEAGKALNAINLKEIKGRQVAVDWAVAKDKFVATQPGAKKEEKVAAEKAAPESDSEEEEKVEEEEEKKKPEAHSKNKVSSKPAQQPDSPSEHESEEDDEEDHEEDEDSESQESDCDETSDLGSDEDDDDEEDEDSDSAANRKPLPSDINQGKTVFIRNLSFDTEEEGLEEVLLQYGELKYIKICLHPDTEHSKGIAFAQFKSKEAAEKCIADAEDESESGGIRVDGRKLNIVAAVSREDAVKLKDKKVKTHTGTRNLYLAREGLIRSGTKAAEGVPAADMAKRTRFEDLKLTKLRDINVFVSKTRLCVHNLPKFVDVKQLRKLCLKAAGGGKVVRITECRVMYDKKPERGQVLGRSLGYGFVQFQEHEHALKTLRYLNNNPDIYGNTKRPIAEFSLEDGKKLKMKEMRQQQVKERFKGRGPQGGVKPQSGGKTGLQRCASKPQSAMVTKVGPAKTQTQSLPSGQDRKDGVPPPQPQAQTLFHAQTQPQDQKQGRQYAGFQTTPVLEHVELEDGKKRRKVLALPSHRGPKIRARDKGKPQPAQPKKPKNRPSRRELQGGTSLEKPTQPRTKSAKGAKKRFRNQEDDRFDNLVEQYKRKLMGGNKTTNIKKNKWFNS